MKGEEQKLALLVQGKGTGGKKIRERFAFWFCISQGKWVHGFSWLSPLIFTIILWLGIIVSIIKWKNGTWEINRPAQGDTGDEYSHNRERARTTGDRPAGSHKPSCPPWLHSLWFFHATTPFSHVHPSHFQMDHKLKHLPSILRPLNVWVPHKSQGLAHPN